MVLFANAMISILLVTTPPPAPPAADALSDRANNLRHVETDDSGSAVDARAMQEQALQEKDDAEGDASSTTGETSDDSVEDIQDRRRPRRIRRPQGPDGM